MTEESCALRRSTRTKRKNAAKTVQGAERPPQPQKQPPTESTPNSKAAIPADAANGPAAEEQQADPKGPSCAPQNKCSWFVLLVLFVACMAVYVNAGDDAWDLYNAHLRAFLNGEERRSSSSGSHRAGHSSLLVPPEERTETLVKDFEER
jgi:hypothetical protein